MVNTASGVNQADIRVEQRDGQPGLALVYTITQPPPNGYVLAERCFAPEQNWSDARTLELWLENDQQPKTLVVQDVGDLTRRVHDRTKCDICHYHCAA